MQMIYGIYKYNMYVQLHYKLIKRFVHFFPFINIETI